MNRAYNLLDNIHIKQYDFKGADEEIFCSSAWKEEIILDSESIVRTESIINGTALRKVFNNRTISKIIDGICEEEDIDFNDLKDYIELPSNYSHLKENSSNKQTIQSTKKIYEDFNIYIDDFNYKELYRKIEKLLITSNLRLIKIVGNSQYSLFKLMNSEGRSGYGYRNAINITVSYKKNSINQYYSEIFSGTNIYNTLNKISGKILRKEKYEIGKIGQIEYIPPNIEGIVIQSDLFAKLIDTFYFTQYINTGKIQADQIPGISKLVSIVVNDIENDIVGGDINGLGEYLLPQTICNKGESKDFFGIFRRYDYRENPRYILDKIKILPGEDDMSDFYLNHIIEICELRGMEESYNPRTMEFVAFISGKEYNKGKVTKRIKIIRKLNLVKILQSIKGIGNICRYELDGRLLAPDIIINSQCLEKE